jgi:proliferating cell nuclear antigen
LLLHARINNVFEWKAVVSAIGDIVEEAMFICTNDGVTFRGMDTAHVALLDVTFPKSSFTFYKNKTSFFGINIVDFKAILNSCGNDDLVEISIEKDHEMNVKVNGSLKMEFNLKLIEKTETNTPIPKIDYKTKATIEPAVLTRVLSNLRSLSEYISINSQIQGMQFLSKGDSGDAMISIEKNSPELMKYETLEDTNAVYSLDYMAKIIRNIGKASRNISIEYSNQNPMHMLFEMNSQVTVNYYLAPRIEN